MRVFEGEGMNKVYVVHVSDSNTEWSCVGTFTTQIEANKCFEWWKEHGDWDYVYIEEYDVFEKFYESLYGE